MGPLMVETAGPPSTETVLAFSEELTRIACSGGGMKALAAHLAQRIEAAILVEDAEWRHLGLSGATGRTVPPSVRDLISNSVSDTNGAMRFVLPGGTEGVAFPDSCRRVAARAALDFPRYCIPG